MSDFLLCKPGYMAKLDEAKSRIAHNEKQGQCPRCKRWYWHEEHDYRQCAGHPLDLVGFHAFEYEEEGG